MKQLVIIGEGGHSKVIQDIIRVSNEYEIIAILDDKYKSKSLCRETGITRGPVSCAFKFTQSESFFIIAIGSNQIRKKITSLLKRQNAKFASVIHPTAVISPTVKLGEGIVIMANAVINSDAAIGNHVIINTTSVIEHDNKIADFVHVSPGAILAGDVTVGEGTQVGAGSTIIQGKEVNEWSIIGAGATVINNIPAGVVAVGVPAKIIKEIL
ncbi:acetyltransferase EpsM [Lederbergia galactosidilyticus]|uniref:acetyltransferase n=1 Tax=Lederbergia galactosidilytica TaxID=217031 RepID=UPI001AE6A11B|nr:acetyltransferase EpsM [Lederbergia galactosidilytica]